MFERGRTEGSGGATPVEITLEGGRELKGRFNISPGRSLSEVLNSPLAFIEFEASGGQRILIAKSALQAVKQRDLPSVPNLPTGTNNFDPFSVLHLDRDADAEQARRAFVELSKVYHPDRFATVELPPEVSHYLAAMARRINVAYEEVQDAIKGREQLAADRHEPIFTKAG